MTTLNSSRTRIRKFAYLALFTALVILLQSVGQYIKLGSTSVSLVLIPIVLGGMLLGKGAGLFLGLVFGFMTLLAGVTGTDSFTTLLFTQNPFGTTILCLGKAALAGFGAAFLYHLIRKKNEVAAIYAATIAAPVLNTGFFIGYCILFMQKSILSFMGEIGIADTQTVIYFLLIGCAGINFILELAVNLIVSPALKTVINVFRRKNGHVGGV